jgi:hypothetical protein
MATEEAIKALADKLKELETQLAQSQPGPITVKVPRDRKLRRFTGVRDDSLLEDWIVDAERSIAGQTDADAVDFLMYHLDGAAKDEIRLRPAGERERPAQLFKILRDSFGEGLTSTQAMRKFFERKQRDRETVRDFCHALMLLLARVERLQGTDVPNKDRLLQDQLLENLRDASLRRDIKRWVRDHPDKSFQQIREEVQHWIDEDGGNSRSARVREVAQVEDDATTCESTQAVPNLQKVINDLVSGQRILTESLQKQQDLLTNHIEQQRRATKRNERAIAELRAGKREPQDRKRLECYGCGKVGHYRRDCPNEEQNRVPGGGKADERSGRRKSALNENAPRQ